MLLVGSRKASCFRSTKLYSAYRLMHRPDMQSFRKFAMILTFVPRKELEDLGPTFALQLPPRCEKTEMQSPAANTS